MPVTMGTGDSRDRWSRRLSSAADEDLELPWNPVVDRVALQVGETWAEVRLVPWLAGVSAGCPWVTVMVVSDA